MRRPLGLGAFSLAFLATCVPAWGAGAPSVVFTDLGSHGPERRYVVEALGLDGELVASLGQATLSEIDWHRVFPVFVVDSSSSNVGAEPPPLLGRYELVASGIRFTPRFDLQEGVSYLAELRVAEPPLNQTAGPPAPPYAIFEVPTRLREPTAIVAVYPSAGRLPANLLRFYVHFSGPMRRGEAYRHIRLLDAAGTEVEAPFLELEQELWDADTTRLTLLLDPGRIKSGLVPRRELGPAIEPGSAYYLVIGGDWPDAYGRPLVAGYSRSFAVGEPDSSPPDPGLWVLSSPRAGSREPLEIELGETLDQALLQRLIWIIRADSSRLVPSRLEVDPGEHTLRFTPADPWLAGKYTLNVDPALEDIAGNSVARPFERDLQEPEDAGIRPRTVAFEVR